MSKTFHSHKVTKGFCPQFQHNYKPQARKNSVPLVTLEKVSSVIYSNSMPELRNAIGHCIYQDEFRVATVQEKKFVQNMINGENCSKEMSRYQQKRFAQ